MELSSKKNSEISIVKPNPAQYFNFIWKSNSFSLGRIKILFQGTKNILQRLKIQDAETENLTISAFNYQIKEKKC